MASEGVTNQANAIRRAVRSFGGKRAVSGSKAKAGGAGRRTTRTGQVVPTSKRNRGGGTITKTGLKALRRAGAAKPARTRKAKGRRV